MGRSDAFEHSGWFDDAQFCDKYANASLADAMLSGFRNRYGAMVNNQRMIGASVTSRVKQ
jgi:hypothetical protein